MIGYIDERVKIIEKSLISIVISVFGHYENSGEYLLVLIMINFCRRILLVTFNISHFPITFFSFTKLESEILIKKIESKIT